MIPHGMRSRRPNLPPCPIRSAGGHPMVEPTHQWSFTARNGLTQWYGHVRLLPGHALGQWFCVDRRTGKPLWERSFSRPNSVNGVADGVIVASETQSVG